MINERQDVFIARKGKDGKSHFTKVGSAWPNAKGGVSLTLEALPAPERKQDSDELVYRLVTFPPKPRENDPFE